jgi:hypothetical protein
MQQKTSGLALALRSAGLGATLALGFTLSPQAIDVAQAGVEYPWCAVYRESTVGATNCGFSTLAQCRATISGVGGMCTPNPAYAGPPPRPLPKRQGQSR